MNLKITNIINRLPHSIPPACLPGLLCGWIGLKPYSKILFLLFTITIIIPQRTFSQYNFKIYTVEDGLSQSQVISLCQDSRGYLWMGTYGGGVCKYDGRFFTNYSIKDGLSNNIVYAIIEDRSGNLWFGTDGGGVSRFDGSAFIQFTEKDGLCNDHVYSIIEDVRGNIWVGTYGGGVSKITSFVPNSSGNNSVIPHNRTFTNIDTSDGLISNNVMVILEDSKGNLWFGTEEGASFLQITQFKEDTGQILKNNQQSSIEQIQWKHFTTNNGLSDNKVYAILEDHNGNIWFGTFGGGISILMKRKSGSNNADEDSDNEQWKHISIDQGLPDNRITALFEDVTGNIWIGTYGAGVCKLVLSEVERSYLNTTTSFEFINYTEQEGLGNNHISSILEDRVGNLWFGTQGGGLNKYMGETFTHFTTNEGLSSNIVSSINEDGAGNLWFGTYGSGVNKLVLKESDPGLIQLPTYKFMNFSSGDGLTDDIVLTMMEDISRKTWLGTNSGVSIYDNKVFSHFNLEQLNDNSILSIYEDKSANIWFGTDGGGVVRYDPNTSSTLQFTDNEELNNDIVWSIIQDRSGNIWLGTWGGGVSKLIPSQGENPHYSIENITEQEGLSNNFVLTILEDAPGNLWFGTYGGGISILRNTKIQNPKLDISYDWVYINTTNGLSDDGVVSMTFDDDDNLWVGTNKGVNRISNIEQGKLNAELFNIRQYGKLEGFVGTECNQNAICNDSKGNIWFGTANVLTKYNPEADQLNTIEPKTHITGLRLFFEEVDWKNYADSIAKYYPIPINLSLPYTKNHLTFEFIGISLKIPEKVKYQYMLKGLDNDWSPPAKENFATYPKLPPGNYTFMVKAANNDGVWNKDPVTFSFAISPPFWQTWWFYIMCTLFGAASIYAVILIRIRSLQRAKRILKKQVKLRTRQLRQEKILVEKQKVELEITNNNLNEAYNKLKELEDFKESMMGMIVHDLKNPLNSILNFSKYRPSGKILNNIYEAGKKMLNLVMNILDIQKFEEAEMQLKTDHHYMNTALDEAIQQVRASATQKGVEIKNSVKNDIAGRFDVEIITRVVINLLTNAVKFTDSGGEITISAEINGEKDKSMVMVKVSDTGEGIPAEKLSTVFERFLQVESKDLGSTGSTGIGLTFCKLAVEAHGGSIGVDSEVGKGSTFHFTLPKGDSAKITETKKKIKETKVEEVEPVIDDYGNEEIKEELVFNSEEKEYFRPFIEKFDGITVFHTSDIAEILNQMTDDKINLLQSWKEEMQTAIDNCNERRFEELLGLLK